MDDSATYTSCSRTEQALTFPDLVWVGREKGHHPSVALENNKRALVDGVVVAVPSGEHLITKGVNALGLIEALDEGGPFSVLRRCLPSPEDVLAPLSGTAETAIMAEPMPPGFEEEELPPGVEHPAAPGTEAAPAAAAPVADAAPAAAVSASETPAAGAVSTTEDPAASAAASQAPVDYSAYGYGAYAVPGAGGAYGASYGYDAAYWNYYYPGYAAQQAAGGPLISSKTHLQQKRQVGPGSQEIRAATKRCTEETVHAGEQGSLSVMG